MEPVAEPVPESTAILGSGEVIRVDYDLTELRVTLVFGDRANSVSVVFPTPIGFRVLDEGDLTEFWGKYHTGNGWLYEVKSGGWHDLESNRDSYLTKVTNEVREYLVVGENDCVSVIVHESVKPKVIGGNAT